MGNYYFPPQYQPPLPKFESRTKKEILRELRDREAFATWLLAWDAGAQPIGKAGRGDEEPLIQYLQQDGEYICRLISDEAIYVSSSNKSGGAEEIPLPDWAVNYLKQITDNGRKYGDPVTAENCLSALGL